eukprot:8280908-Pyramimonas_sp.AAC.1
MGGDCELCGLRRHGGPAILQVGAGSQGGGGAERRRARLPEPVVGSDALQGSTVRGNLCPVIACST